MNFYPASLEINNLGGYCGMTGPGCIDESGIDDLTDPNLPLYLRQGYDKTQPILYYKNIGNLRPVGQNAVLPPMSIDLKVEVAPGSGYRANNGQYNGFGKGDNFGQINMGGREGTDFTAASPTENDATFIFTLMDQRTRLPLANNMVKFFSFTYFDFDMPNNDGRGRECLELLEPAAENYGYEAGNSVAVTEGFSGKKFCANGAGTKDDNPELPSDATDDPEVEKRAVALEFRDTQMIKVKYTVACCIGSGRNFVFAGAPFPMVKCEKPPPAPAIPNPPPIPPSPPSPPSSLSGSGSGSGGRSDLEAASLPGSGSVSA